MMSWRVLTQRHAPLGETVMACAFEAIRRVSDEQLSKPAHREAPPSA